MKQSLLRSVWVCIMGVGVLAFCAADPAYGQITVQDESAKAVWSVGTGTHSPISEAAGGNNAYQYSTSPNSAQQYTWKPGLTGTYIVDASWGAHPAHATSVEYFFDSDGYGVGAGEVSVVANVNFTQYADQSTAAPGPVWSEFYELGTFELTADSEFRVYAFAGYLTAAAWQFEDVSDPGPVIANSSGYSITWDGNDGDHFDTAAPTGGSIVPANLALNGTAFASSEASGFGHTTVKLNDGFYGNVNSWIGSSDPANAGILLDGMYVISSFAFGRDNGNNSEAGQYTERCLGTYTIEFTSDGGSTWFEAGTITYNATPAGDGAPGGTFDPYYRHEYEVETTGGGSVIANGIRITVPEGDVFSSGTAIDEIEVYGTAWEGPGGVEGSVLWLKADDLDLADGADVTVWSDLSGNNNSLNRSGLAYGAAPTFQTNAPGTLNGKPSLSFDVSASTMWTEEADPEIVAQEVFVVATLGSAPGSIPTLMSFGREGTAPFQQIRANGAGETYFDDAAFDFGGGADGILSINGEAGTDITFNVPHIYNSYENAPATYTNVFLGWNVVWGRPWKGEVAEIIVFSNKLSAADRNAVNQYLSTKYGISVAAPREADTLPPVTNGLTAWFSANNLLEYSNGEGVALWTNSLGNTIELEHTGVGGGAPVLQLDSINGNASVYFNGSALRSDDTDPVIQAQDIFVVTTMSNDSVNIATLMTLGAEGTTPFQSIRRNGTDQAYADDASFDFGGGADGDIRIDGAFGTAITFADPHIFNGAESSLGTYTNIYLGWNVVHGRPWKGQVAEILIFSNKLSTADRNTINQYLADKYGIADVPEYRSLDAPPPVTNGLTAWFNANDLLEHTDGAPVTEWVDSLGNGITLDRTGLGGSAPTLQTNAPDFLNGRVSVSFDGNAIWTDATEPAIDAQDIFVVATLDTGADSIATMFTLGAEGYPPFQQIRAFPGTQAYGDDAAFDFGGGADGDIRINGARGTDITLNEPHLYNGTEYTAGTYTNIYLGWNVVHGRYWKGQIAEILIFSNRLSTADRDSINQYLADKYGIPDVLEYRTPDDPPPVTSGLVAWFNANSVLDGADGDSIDEWEDSSGNGITLNRIGSPGGAAPTLQTNAPDFFNGQQTLSFTDSHLWTEATDPEIQARDIFVVATMASGIGDIANVLLSVGREGVFPFNEVRRYDLATAYGENATYDFGGGADGIVRINGSEGNAITYDVPHIFNGTEDVLYTYTNLFVGWNVQYGRPWLGQVAEILIYSNELSIAQRNSINQYLADKYGIENVNEYRSPDADPPVTNGLTAWFNANDLLTHADGDPVTEWEDSLGNGIVLDHTGVGGSPPVFQTNAPGFLNGRVSVSFDNNGLWTVPQESEIQAQDIFVVATMESDATSIATLLSLGAEGYPPYQQIRRDGTAEAYADSAAFDFGGGADGIMRINGTQGSAITYGVPHIFSSTENTAQTYTNFYLGWNVVHGRSWKGQVAEILVFSNRLSLTERNAIGLYLANKYGIDDTSFRTPDATPPASDALEVWLNAHDLIELGDGASITEWEDRSGNGNHVNRTGLAYGSAPVLHTNEPGVFNGKPSLTFNLSTLWTDAEDPEIQAQEVYAVVTMANDADNIATLMSLGREGTAPFQEIRRGGTAEAYADDAGYDFGGGGDGIIRINGATGTGITYNEPHIFSAVENNPATYTNLFLGWNVIWGRPWKGEVAELIVYNRNLNVEERNAVGVYLADKYGITDTRFRELDDDPPVTTGLEVWLNANDLADLDGGDSVTEWEDRSGNGNHVNRTGLGYGSAPVIQTNIPGLFNGNAAVAFDGSTLWTEENDPAIQAREIFTVVTMASDADSIATLLSVGREGTPPFQQVRRNGTDQAYGDDAGFDFGGGADGTVNIDGSVGTAITYDTPHVFHAIENTTETYTNLFLGWNVTWGRPWKGYVAEVLIYDRELTVSQRNQITTYLTNKYGTALTTPSIGTLGAISGSAAVCSGEDGVVYSVDAVAGALNYDWSVPSFASITAGQGTTQITVDWGTAASGNVTVTAENTYAEDTEALAVSVSSSPVIVDSPDNASVCSGLSANMTATAFGASINYAWRKLGSGWGETWSFTGSGHGLGDSTANNSGDAASNGGIDIGDTAWLLANTGSDAVRNLGSTLSVGQVFSIDMDHGNNGDTVGFELRNASGETVIAFYQEFGVGYTIDAGSTVGYSTPAFTRAGVNVEIRLTSSSTYYAQVTRHIDGASAAATGNLLSPAGGQSITQLRLFNNSGASGDNTYNVYFNNISFAGTTDAGDNYGTWTAGSDLGETTLTDGGAISGAATASLIINPVSSGDAGDYNLVVWSTCARTTSSNATLTVFDAPADYNVTGGTDCEDSGVTVGLDGSDVGIDYQLYLDGVAVGSDIPGTGSAISFGLQTDPGTYTVGASENGNCTAIMSGSAIVNTTPTISLGAGPAVVTGSTSANLTYVATTGSPNQYSIDYDGAAAAQGFTDVVNGTLTASPISLVVPGGAALGTYNATLTVRNSITGCESGSYAFTVTITATPPPPDAPTALAATVVQPTSFQANWSASIGADDYRLDVSTVNNFSSFVSGYNNLTVNDTFSAVTGLTPGDTYYYRVRAASAYGTSDSSGTISLTLPETATIDIVEIFPMSSSSGDLTWGATPGADYDVMYSDSDPGGTMTWNLVQRVQAGGATETISVTEDSARYYKVVIAGEDASSSSSPTWGVIKPEVVPSGGITMMSPPVLTDLDFQGDLGDQMADGLTTGTKVMIMSPGAVPTWTELTLNGDGDWIKTSGSGGYTLEPGQAFFLQSAGNETSVRMAGEVGNDSGSQIDLQVGYNLIGISEGKTLAARTVFNNASPVGSYDENAADQVVILESDGSWRRLIRRPNNTWYDTGNPNSTGNTSLQLSPGQAYYYIRRNSSTTLTF